MPAGYSHTTRAAGLTLTANIYNADHVNHTNQGPATYDDYSTNVAQMQAATDPGEVGSESQPTTLAGELERLRFVIEEFKSLFATGIAQWYSTVSGGSIIIPSGSTLSSGVSSQAGSTGNYVIPSIINRDVTSAEAINTTGETTVYSFSLPGNTITPGRMIRLTGQMDYLNNTGVNGRQVTLKAKYGSTTFSDMRFSGNSIATRYPVQFISTLCVRTATGEQIGQTYLAIGGDATITGGVTTNAMVGLLAAHHSVAEDTTSAQNIIITLTPQVASTGLAGRLQTLEVELL